MSIDLFRRVFSFCILLVLSEFISLSCQILPLKNYSVKEGLISNNANTFCQDKRGYLWIGCAEGISVFNGLMFTNYSPSSGLALNYINQIIEDRFNPGVMWIATNGGGISKYNYGKFSTYKIGSSNKTIRVNAILQDFKGRIWCGTDNGVFIISGDSVSPFYPKKITGSISALTESKDDNIYICSMGVIYEYQTSSSSIVSIQEYAGVKYKSRNLKSIVSRLYIGNNNIIWAGTVAGDVFKIKGSNILAHFSAPGSSINFISEDKNGNLWIGSAGNTLFKFNENKFPVSYLKLTSKNGLPNSFLINGFFDSQNDLWLSYVGKGIYEFRENSYYKFPFNAQRYYDNNLKSASDKNGRIWTCAGGKLFELWRDSSGNWKQYYPAIAEPNINSAPEMVYYDRAGLLWICFSNGDFKSFSISAKNQNLPSSLKQMSVLRKGIDFPNANVLCFFVDDKGYLWISLDDLGVALVNTRLNKSFVKLYSNKDGLPGNSVRALYEDSNGNIWFGGFMNGLGVLSSKDLNNGKIVTFTKKNGLPGNSIRAILEDDFGRMWIGTRYTGVAVIKLKGKLQDDNLFNLKNNNISITVVKTLDVQSGLLSNAIWAEAKDDSGRIWLGTESGLMDIMQNNFTPLNRYNWQIGSAIFSCGVTKGNICWAYALSGLKILDLNSSTHSVPEPVYISHLFVNGIEKSAGKSILLSYNQNNINLNYEGISLKDGKDITYQYRLEGLDDKWSSPSDQHSVTYAHLAPGDYTFEVKAINDEGKASVEPAVLSFTIIPPFWHEWWFIIFSLLLIGGTVFFLMKFRIKRVVEIERIRSRIATDLHDEIGSGLTRIAFLSEIISKKTKSNIVTAEDNNFSELEIAPSLQRVGSIARELVEAMGDVVWSINPNHDSIISLIQKIKAYSHEVCDNLGISLTFVSSASVEKIILPASHSPEILRSILLITKEALTNIAKHSHCTEAEIKIDADKRAIYLSIKDNGYGFEVGSNEEGNGLANMQNRASKVRGIFAIKSAPGTGTAIYLSIPR
ncbi:MAG: sensor histidine kinase [Ignavibacteriaceae bacterium]